MGSDIWKVDNKTFHYMANPNMMKLFCVRLFKVFAFLYVTVGDFSIFLALKSIGFHPQINEYIVIHTVTSLFIVALELSYSDDTNANAARSTSRETASRYDTS